MINSHIVRLFFVLEIALVVGIIACLIALILIRRKNRLNDLAYYQDRLANPSLLERAIWIGNELYVPVGGKRRSGFGELIKEERKARRITRILGEYPELFPNPRVESFNFEDGAERFMVAWGEQTSWVKIFNGEISPEDTIEEIITVGRLLGYTETSLQEHKMHLKEMAANRDKFGL